MGSVLVTFCRILVGYITSVNVGWFLWLSADVSMWHHRRLSSILNSISHLSSILQATSCWLISINTYQHTNKCLHILLYSISSVVDSRMLTWRVVVRVCSVTFCTSFVRGTWAHRGGWQWRWLTYVQRTTREPYSSKTEVTSHPHTRTHLVMHQDWDRHLKTVSVEKLVSYRVNIKQCGEF